MLVILLMMTTSVVENILKNPLLIFDSIIIPPHPVTDTNNKYYQVCRGCRGRTFNGLFWS